MQWMKYKNQFSDLVMMMKANNTSLEVYKSCMLIRDLVFYEEPWESLKENYKNDLRYEVREI